jgi:predicted nicotinamide N-methyase
LDVAQVRINPYFGFNCRFPSYFSSAALPGLFCAQLASKIALTDKSKRILASSKRSVAANAIPDSRLCLVERLTFGNQSEGNDTVSKLGSSSEIDLIIASDVLYGSKHFSKWTKSTHV